MTRHGYSNARLAERLTTNKSEREARTVTNRDTARRAIEELDRRHEPAEEFYTKDSMTYMLNNPPFDIHTYKTVHAPTFFSAFPDLIHNIENVMEERDTVMLDIVCTGTHKGSFMGIEATHRQVSYRSVIFYDFVDGKISRTRGVYDQMGLLEQIGAKFVPSG